MKAGGGAGREPSADEFLAETPRLGELYEYWRGLPARAGVPDFGDIDPFRLRGLADSCVFVRVEPGGAEFCFWQIGPEVLPFLTEDYTGRRLSQIASKRPGTAIWHVYRKVYTTRLPYYAAFDYIGPAAGIRSSREVYLPFGEPGVAAVTDIVVAIRFSCEPVPALPGAGSARAPAPYLGPLITPAAGLPDRPVSR